MNTEQPVAIFRYVRSKRSDMQYITVNADEVFTVPYSHWWSKKKEEHVKCQNCNYMTAQVGCQGFIINVFPYKIKDFAFCGECQEDIVSFMENAKNPLFYYKSKYYTIEGWWSLFK